MMINKMTRIGSNYENSIHSIKTLTISEKMKIMMMIIIIIKVMIIIRLKYQQ